MPTSAPRISTPSREERSPMSTLGNGVTSCSTRRVGPYDILTRYKAWTDSLMMSALRQVPITVLTEPRSIVFGSLLRTLHHVYAIDAVWRAHLEGRRHGYSSRNPDECPTFEMLASRQAEMDAWYVDYATSLAECLATERVAFTFIGGGPGDLSRGEILLHVVNHTTYHRGHAADMLYESGYVPPTTDLPVFMRSRTDGVTSLPAPRSTTSGSS
jgi:uncharacterized damage-inducible protein DinB